MTATVNMADSRITTIVHGTMMATNVSEEWATPWWECAAFPEIVKEKIAIESHMDHIYINRSLIKRTIHIEVYEY